MSTLYLLIPIGLVFLALAIKMLFWAINSGQYDDLDMEAHRILFDDDLDETKTQASQLRPKHTASDKRGSVAKTNSSENNDKPLDDGSR